MDYLVISLLFSLLFCLILQLYYSLVIHRKLAEHKEYQSYNQVLEPISVIICAKNELENLKKNLLPFLELDYPDFEIIIVNDCSYDGSDWYLRDLSLQFKNLKLVTIDDNPPF